MTGLEGHRSAARRSAGACRACGGHGLELVLDLGAQPPAERLVRPEEADRPDAVFPLQILLCPTCFLVQLNRGADRVRQRARRPRTLRFAHDAYPHPRFRRRRAPADEQHGPPPRRRDGKSRKPPPRASRGNRRRVTAHRARAALCRRGPCRRRTDDERPAHGEGRRGDHSRRRPSRSCDRRALPRPRRVATGLRTRNPAAARARRGRSNRVRSPASGHRGGAVRRLPTRSCFVSVAPRARSAVRAIRAHGRRGAPDAGLWRIVADLRASCGGGGASG